MSGDMAMPRRGHRDLLAWLVVGAAYCTLLQVVFWNELGAYGVRMYPFIWAYSQYAWLDLIIPSSGPQIWIAQSVMWAAFYAAISLCLWLLLRSRPKLARHWPWSMAVVGWTIVQLLLAGTSACAWTLGIIEME